MAMQWELTNLPHMDFRLPLILKALEIKHEEHWMMMPERKILSIPECPVCKVVSLQFLVQWCDVTNQPVWQPSSKNSPNLSSTSLMHWTVLWKSEWEVRCLSQWASQSGGSRQYQGGEMGNQLYSSAPLYTRESGSWVAGWYLVVM